MCRALLYLGEPVLLDNFLYQPDSALVRQTYMPKMLNMLNLAGFGPAEHRLLSQVGFEGLQDILEVDLDTFRTRLTRAADELKMEPPSDLTIEGWWDQAHTLAE